MSRPLIVSLFDKTTTFLQPWAEAGYATLAVDIQHPPGLTVSGDTLLLHADLRQPFHLGVERVGFVAAFPPCTHLAVSGARWFKGKGLRALSESIEMFATAAEFAEASGAPYLIENPVSTISTYWRKPDFTFHPYEFSALEPGDNYTKKTCLWTGGGFIMPEPQPDQSLGEPDNRIHTAPPSKERADIRSATPLEFARAVFAANQDVVGAP